MFDFLEEKSQSETVNEPDLMNGLPDYFPPLELELINLIFSGHPESVIKPDNMLCGFSKHRLTAATKSINIREG